MKATRTCPINLVHWAPHGPVPSVILPWQVTSQRFANERSIPVCGHGSTVVILLASPEVSADGTRFTAGTLVVSIKPKK